MISFGHKGITVSRIIVLQNESQGFAIAAKALILKYVFFSLLKHASSKTCMHLNYFSEVRYIMSVTVIISFLGWWLQHKPLFFQTSELEIRASFHANSKYVSTLIHFPPYSLCLFVFHLLESVEIGKSDLIFHSLCVIRICVWISHRAETCICIITDPSCTS